MKSTRNAHPILHVHLLGNLANRMIQYMVACRIAGKATGCHISNVVLPEWGIDHPNLMASPCGSVNIPVSRGDLDIETMAGMLSSGENAHVDFKSYAQWFPNFPDLDFCRSIFPSDEVQYPGFGPEYLVCNVRGGDILDGNYAHYVLLPIEFYGELAAATGKKLVFMGQIADNRYCQALRCRFPDALFLSSQGAIADFQTFRNSKNLVMAVSSFSWLAAWLSRADLIVMPISGMFNPIQCPAIDLLSYPDDRYWFYMFPKNYAVPVDQFEEAHKALQGKWHRLDTEEIPKLRASVYRCSPRYFDQFKAVFDEAFYLKTHPDVARLVRAGRLLSGLDHYITHGFSEGRQCFPFNDRWYASQYPDAVSEVGQERYESLLHHFVLAGSAQGYRPRPQPVLEVELIGGLAERMVQYLVARRVAAEVQDCRLYNATLPEWGVDHSPLGAAIPNSNVTFSSSKGDIAEIVEVLRCSQDACARFKSSALWFPSLPNVEFCRSLFPANEEYPSYGSEYLVCHIEIARNFSRQPHHVLLPIGFYEDLAKTTGLKIVFMGRMETNAYWIALQQRFPDAIFHPIQDTLAGFQTLRNSKNLVPAVSTFSWLAAWLSHAQMIVLPVNGLFHPMQVPEVDLLPCADKRYRFYLFPINYATPVDEFEKSHTVLHDSWRYIGALAASKLRPPRGPKLDLFLPLFNEAFYLQTYKDVARAVQSGGIKSALDHYIRAGFREGRAAFPFDPRWYSREYPRAALEVGRGNYQDFVHHFLEAGRLRGYRATPP